MQLNFISSHFALILYLKNLYVNLVRISIDGVIPSGIMCVCFLQFSFNLIEMARFYNIRKSNDSRHFHVVPVLVEYFFFWNDIYYFLITVRK